jgi:hydrophobe/amphiphile efflux-1 (HAE1) family protein
MLSKFFIHRPIFASVISVLIVIAGVVCVPLLPIAQYPDITPPVIQVTCVYPGADPQVLADTVAAPIEQEVNGVEKMLYMSSTCASNGSYTLKITFELGTNVDMANVLVQNRVARATPKLPPEVQRQGITTKKSSTAMVTILSFYSPDKKYDDLYITNFVTIRVKDSLSRINGVGDVTIFPTKDYAMRVWLDPAKMDARSLTTNDVVNALRAQNVQVAAGALGQLPAPPGTDYQLTINMRGRLNDIEQFQNVIVKTSKGEAITRLKDVARVELGGKSYDTSSTFNSSPSATVIVYQTPGSNALDVADQIQKTVAGLKSEFPPGLEVRNVWEVSKFVHASIESVIHTLFEAFVLVFLVVFVFLQDWRATLVPAITIPVALIGTFAVMLLLGFSINMITLLGMVLAIGIVVDDAIVVVESVEHNMTTHHLSPLDATLKSMSEITGAIVGITLVLMAVFIPPAFMGGITGALYRQFSITIAITVFFSAVNALTLSPALCAILLKPHQPGKKKFVLFRAFNSVFDKFTVGYTFTVRLAVRHAIVCMLFFVGFIVLTVVTAKKVPSGFIPAEDDGLVLVNVQLPDSASMQRTDAAGAQIVENIKKIDGVQDVVFLGGFSVIDSNASYFGTAFIALKPWDERLPQGRSRDVIVREINRTLFPMQNAVAFAFTLPPISGLGNGSGFEMMVEDKSSNGLVALAQSAQEVAATANTQSDLSSVIATFRAQIPTLFVDVNRERVLSQGMELQAVYDTMQAYLGSSYVNDFNKFGRTWQVTVQADSADRVKPSDITHLKVRNAEGQMVPLGAFVSVTNSLGPPRIDRYNLYPAARVMGVPAPGISSGVALNVMDQLADKTLPNGIGYEWTSLAFQQKKSGGQDVVVFSLAIIVVVLLLAAQYESWLDPIAVVLSVPLAALGAMAALLARNLDNNIFTQVGLVLLVGLAAKNAILIVEFAREIRTGGKTVPEAAVEAARLRFRPILMTSFAFILGVVPLVLAKGAGAAASRSMGTAVFGGMLGGTILGVLFIPTLWVIMQRKSKKPTPTPPHEATHPPI